MPDDTTILSLPLILPAQAQKHVTHNEALAQLDLIVQLAVISRALTDAPALPSLGDRYIVADGATGTWAGQTGKIALHDGTGWQFTQALPGWQAHVLAEGQTAVFDGLVWATPSDGPLTVTALGISATADATNRLSVAAAATLLTHAGAGHQLKLNKALATDTASLLFQTGFSGRAEMGTAGSDDFAIKVSADGTSFSTTLSAEAATGEVTLPAPLHLGGQAADPAMPSDGTLWLNTTSGEVKVKSAGVTMALGGGGGVSDGDKGDVIVSASGTAWTIDAGAVTLDKLAYIATDTLIGRDSEGTGAPEALSPAMVRAILNVANGSTANASDAALRDRATHTGTQTAATIVDFAAAVAATAAVTANTAKVTNATHTGDVSGSGALTLEPASITGRVSVTPDAADYVLISDTSDGGALKKALVSGLGGGGGGTPGGAVGGVQYNASGVFAGASDVGIEAGQLRLTHVASPAAPAADGVKLFGGKLAGMMLPAFKGPNGFTNLMQPFLGRGFFGVFQPLASGAAGSSVGFNPAFSGASSVLSPSSGVRGRLPRNEYLVTTTAIAQFRHQNAHLSVGGEGDGAGGFFASGYWGPSTGETNAVHRAFAGLRPAIAPTNGNPSTLVNMVGMGWDSADTNVQFMHNSGTGTASKIDLGADFPKPSALRADTYYWELSAPPGTTQSVSYRIVRLESGAVAEGTVTTNLPGTTTFLTPQTWMSIGGATAGVETAGIAIGPQFFMGNYKQ